jgi:3-oxoacyl-[acyl-carrier-protein] synthase-3
MRYDHVCLESFGYALPEEVVTSAELEARLAPVYDRFGLHVGRLELMTGIRQRRFWKPGTLPSDAATLAGRRALEASGVAPELVECILHTAVSRDCLEPATASVVHHNLNLSQNAFIYDISNACLGFINGMINLANMIELGQVQRGLIVAGESSRQLVETTINALLADADLTKQGLKNAFASLTIGSGAVALVMAHDSVSRANHRLIGGAYRAATSHNKLCRGSADTGFGANSEMVMNTDAETLLVRGCELAAETWRRFTHELHWSAEDVDRTFTHQVGIAHRDRLYEAIGIPVAKDFATLPTLGNVGSVSLPITMAIGLEQNPPAHPERIAMLGIGSGLNSVMLGVQW